MLKILLHIRRIIWFITRPQTMGVRAIIIADDSKIALVKSRADGLWYLPGGKVERNESIEDALKRELTEECGIDIQNSVFFNHYFNQYEYKSDHVFVFVVNVNEAAELSRKDKFELSEATWADINTLDNTVSIGSRKRIQEYLNNNTSSHLW